MSMFKRKPHSVPGLNTASLPDLIFSVLFFFMIVTHMRKVTLKVHFQVPQGKELTRLVKKSAVTYIYIGKPIKDGKNIKDSDVSIQLNDKFATTTEDVRNYVLAERKRMSSEDREQMTVSIKADEHVKMGVITDVKQALRKANALRINYSATDKK